MKSYTLEKPLARSLYENIRRDILGGGLKTGERLPSKRTIAENCRVSVITVENALSQLAAEGYIESRPRSGWYVLPQADALKNGEPFQLHLLEEEQPVKKEEEPGKKDGSSRSSAGEFPASLWYKTLRHVISMEGEKLLERSPNKGCARLRNAIAAYLNRYRGMKVQPSQIIIGSGTEAMYQTILKMFSNQVTIAIEDPGYRQIEAVYLAGGANIKKLQMKKDGIDSRQLRETRADFLHVTPFLSFPSGVSAPFAKRQEYLEWARRNDALLIEDDFRSEFHSSGILLPSLHSMDPDRVIYMNTFSESLSPSLRLGYMILPEHLLPLYEEKAGLYSNTVPLLEQYTLAEFLNNGSFERHLMRKRRALKDRQEKAKNRTEKEAEN